MLVLLVLLRQLIVVSVGIKDECENKIVTDASNNSNCIQIELTQFVFLLPPQIFNKTVSQHQMMIIELRKEEDVAVVKIIPRNSAHNDS